MSEQENNGQPTGAPEPKPVLTRREKLLESYNKKFAQVKKLNEEITELVSEINGSDLLQSVVAGSAVVITVGKGDYAKAVDGVVIGVRDEEDGSKTYKVQYGTGFDADIAVVKAGKLSVKVPSTEGAAE
jgi:hypothetical protein